MFLKRPENATFKTLVLNRHYLVYEPYFSIYMSIPDMFSTFIRISRLFIFLLIFLWSKYFDGRKFVDKHIAVLSLSLTI